MEKLNLKFMAAVVTLLSIMTATIANAAPVRFNQVTQVVNVKPGKASSGNFSRLRLTGDDTVIGKTDGSDDDGDKKKAAAPQDDRVITETTSEIVEDEVCDCEEAVVKKGGFPKWALLGLGAIPLIFLIKKGGDDPTPPTTPTETPTTTPTMTPTMTPPVTPTPEEPVPEPMTLLLFGTGLAGIGLAARRKLGKKTNAGDENETEE